MEQKSGGTKLSRGGKTERRKDGKGSRDSISLPSAIASLIAENIGPPFGVRPVGTVPLASVGAACPSLVVPSRPSVGPPPGHSREEIYEGLNSAGRSEERRFPEKITPARRRDATSVR